MPGPRRRLSLPRPERLSDDRLAAELEYLLALQDAERYDWLANARPEQLPPEQFRVWCILAGRGWGKTRTGAETVREWASGPAPQSIAVIARTHREVQAICVEAPRAGLLAVIPAEEVTEYRRASGDVRITTANGSSIRMFSSEDPDVFRGWAFDKVWLDEYAAWHRKSAQDVYDMLWFCLRESTNPQMVITTTPKALPHVKAVVERAGRDGAVVLTRGRMIDNQANLSDAAIAELLASYEGTRLGQQELDGTLLEDVEGALWTHAMFEAEGFRVLEEDVPALSKRVLAIDPAVTSSEESDRYGVCVAGLHRTKAGTLPGMNGAKHVYALLSEAWRATPDQAMRRIVKIFRAWDCDYVVFETNNGGDYIPALLKATPGGEDIPVRKVTAKKAKILRAEPVSLMTEQGRVHHVGPAMKWAKLESVMTTFTGEVQEESPDDLDAYVYAALDLAGPKSGDAKARSAADISRKQVALGGAQTGTLIRRTMPGRGGVVR